MRQLFFPSLVLILLVPSLPSAARARSSSSALEYIDLLSAEVVGELGTQRFDEQLKGSFVGNRDVAGVLVGGGIGVRPVFVLPSGLRFSIETSGTWGRLRDADPGVAYSTVARYEFLTGLGYERAVGRYLRLHTTSLVGVDAVWMDRAQNVALFDATAGAAGSSLSSVSSTSLSRVDLRFGQQLGAHVKVARSIALYADGTIDYDGQWRARAGIAIGDFVR